MRRRSGLNSAAITRVETTMTSCCCSSWPVRARKAYALGRQRVLGASGEIGLNRLNQETQIADLVFQIEEVGLQLLLGDVILGVEPDVTIFLGLLRGEPFGQIGVPRFQLPGSVGVG